MKNKSLIINYTSLFIDEVSKQDRELLDIAKSSLEGSYSPYSCFRVASAVRMDDGKVFSGANQENSAYPSGLCAERVALFYAGANSKAKVVSIAIVAQNKNNDFVVAYPCGACLDVMKEWELRYQNSLKIIVQVDSERVEVFEGVKSLMPFSFTL